MLACLAHLRSGNPTTDRKESNLVSFDQPFHNPYAGFTGKNHRQEMQVRQTLAGTTRVRIASIERIPSV